MSGIAKGIVGAAFGLAVALVAVVGVSALKTGRPEAVPSMGALGAQILSGADALALGCQPHESALVHRVAIHDQPVLSVRCVTLSPGVPAANGAAYPGWVPGNQAHTPTFGTPQVVTTVSAQPTVQRAQPTVIREVQTQRVDQRGDNRSWQKSAMVIGGSTATGAGVGGLVGGKKGALVGAAIGGGTSTIYESAKR